VVLHQANGPERLPCEIRRVRPRSADALDVLGMGIGCEVEIAARTPEKRIANRATNEIQGVISRVESV